MPEQLPSRLLTESFTRFDETDMLAIERSYASKLAKHLERKKKFAFQLIEGGIASLGHAGKNCRRKYYIALLDYYTNQRGYSYRCARVAARYGWGNCHSQNVCRVDRYLLQVGEMSQLMGGEVGLDELMWRGIKNDS